MLPFLQKRWFLIALAFVLFSGMSFSAAIVPATSQIPKDYIVAGIMFLMALPLDASQMWKALSRPTAVTLAVLINFAFLPLAAWGLSLLQSGDLSVGLMIAASSPCTLASAAVWTRRAGGNDAIALLVTMITNLSCLFITPFWLWLTTGTAVELDLQAMIMKLAFVVVLPTFLAQCLRLYRPLGQLATRYKIPLGVSAQCGILCMILIGAVAAGIKLRDPTISATFGSWTAMIISVLVLHTAALFLGFRVGKGVGLSREEWIPVGISGSQKTLAIGLYVALTYYSGLAMIPMILYHVSQLIIDTIVVDSLNANQQPKASQ